MSELISDLRKVPVIRSIIPFIAGILVAVYIKGQASSLLPEVIPIMFLSIIAIPLLGKSNHYWRILASGILIFLAFVTLGSFGYVSEGYFRVEERFLDRKEGYLEGIVTDGAIEKANSWLLRLEGVAFLCDSTQARMDEFVQVYLPPEAKVDGVIPGEHLLVRGKLSLILNNGNPGEFDYAGYMFRRRIRYNFFVRDTGQIRTLTERGAASGYGAARLRQRMIRGWDQEDPDVAVLSALTLGYKSLLGSDTKAAFSDAGAMHLLAVSGLHVGMIWWILEKLIRMPRRRLFWRGLKLSLIVAVLWGYAAVTGFSDSVTRSVTMFSLLALSRSIHRKSNVYNTLLLSAFLLLVLKPSRLLEPGFQLSYLAVAGIVTIQPRLEKLYAGTHPVISRILDLVSVSIAAQISTLPLVLTYFHQFPVWFLLTNLTAIPLVSIILALFVLFVPFLIFFPQWEFFSDILVYVTGFLNQIVTAISSLPGAVVAGIFPDPVAMIVFMGLIISTSALIYYRRVSFLVLSLLLSALIVVIPVCRFFTLNNVNSVTIYNQADVTIISHQKGVLRHTFLLTMEGEPDPYIQKYVQSLSGSPPGTRIQEIFYIHPAGRSKDSSWINVADGIWTINSGSWNVLILGDCDVEVLKMVLGSHPWQVVLFRKGTPFYGIDKVMDSYSGCMVGDGTLRQYEMNRLREKFQEVWLTGEQGALVIKKSI